VYVDNVLFMSYRTLGFKFTNFEWCTLDQFQKRNTNSE